MNSVHRLKERHNYHIPANLSRLYRTKAGLLGNMTHFWYVYNSNIYLYFLIMMKHSIFHLLLIFSLRYLASHGFVVQLFASSWKIIKASYKFTDLSVRIFEENGVEDKLSIDLKNTAKRMIWFTSLPSYKVCLWYASVSSLVIHNKNDLYLDV